jgi:ketosteroid isomerase-like protein
MKYHLMLTLALGLALSTIALAKEKGTKASADKATLEKIEHEISEGILKGDPSAADKYVTSDYLGIGPDGATQNKSEFLSDIKSGTLKLESSTLSDLKVQVADAGTAVVVYRTTDKGTYKGKDITGEYRWLDVFVKRDGRWQIAIDQGTQIAKSQ